jgi:site-specific recombinase XerD
MIDNRQLPLFANQPTSVDDLNKQSMLKDTIALFQHHLIKEGKSEHTIKAFTADLQLLAQYTSEETPIGKYTTDKLNQFLNWMENGRGVPCSRKSYARRVTTLKVYFKWLHEHEAIIHDPAKAVLQRSGPAPLATILTSQEIEDALTFAKTMTRTVRGKVERDTRPELLFRLLLKTGIKKSETVALLPEHIDRTYGVLVIKHKSMRDLYRERNIPLEASWLTLLDEYMAQYKVMPEAPIFNCTARNLEYILTDIGKGAQVHENISFEMLRWTMAVRDYRHGVEPDLIREKMGLSPISWHETHTKIRKLSEKLDEAEAI